MAPAPCSDLDRDQHMVELDAVKTSATAADIVKAQDATTERYDDSDCDSDYKKQQLSLWEVKWCIETSLIEVEKDTQGK